MIELHILLALCCKDIRVPLSVTAAATVTDPLAAALPEFSPALNRLRAARAALNGVILGQSEVIDQCLMVLLAGGHGLLVGMPGLAKSRLVETLAVVMGLNTRRVQFTPDLMPADIIGSEVLEEASDGKRAFRFIPGPVFTQLLMADEINRASPRTQSALLQAMQEGRVAVAGESRPLPQPFHVLATQNPIEQEGTYPLPEAQLDRFLLQITIDYPNAQAERAMLLATTGPTQTPPAPLMSSDDLMACQRLVRALPMGDAVVDAIVRLVRAGRPDGSPLALVQQAVAWGPGPRAGQALMLAVRARALLDGRMAPSRDDVVALAPAILRHRMALSFAARADGIRLEDVIASLMTLV